MMSEKQKQRTEEENLGRHLIESSDQNETNLQMFKY